MKKYGKIILIILLTLLLTLPLFACEDYADTQEELIPTADQMGEQEGFWLYKGDLRMRTDGSEVQTLLPVVELDGKEYLRDEITVSYNHYLPANHKIVFEIKIPENKDDEENTDDYYDNYDVKYDLKYAYLFDYENKTGKTLCELPNGDVTYTYANGFIYMEHYNGAWLFDTDGELLCDSIKGTLKDGLLFDLERYPEGEDDSYAIMEWWYDGGVHSARIDSFNGYSELEIHDGNAYFICQIGGETTVVVVDLYGENVYTTDIFDISYSTDKYVGARRYIETFCYREGALYVLSMVSYDTGDDDDRYWYLYRISGDNAKLVYEFGKVARGVKMSEYKGKFYFKSYILGNLYQRHYKYDLQNGKMKRIWIFSYHGDAIQKSDSSASSSTQSNFGKTKVVGKYKFYVDSAGWGHSGFMASPAGYCYYLRRSYDGEFCIMQYQFTNGYFYDDICDF